MLLPFGYFWVFWMINITIKYMQRCFDLALEGAGSVAPNPMVGAVLVYDDRIIGEGYHEKYGEAHAEVNCIKSVSVEDRHLIQSATMYVSLEPCAHYGKTPPCTQLIIEHHIPKVVIACSDPFSKVNGKGIEHLKAAGIEVVFGILEKEAKELNKRFFVFHQAKRPYIILKWAETINHIIANYTEERLLISNELSNRLVHRWRTEESAIMVGTNTALKDNPALTNRLWTGKNPIRILIDQHLKVPHTSNLLQMETTTIIFNESKTEINELLIYVQIDFSKNIIEQIMEYCYAFPIQSILVEGGAKLLQSFIDSGIWDEARIIQNGSLKVDKGLPAPVLKRHELEDSFQLSTDTIFFYRNGSEKI
jgi:diaminohydroxyphosphoribosylaminopyrimidine deaminase/5-amino-6-(5-phosphoribosylamino)uracil reductase